MPGTYHLSCHSSKRAFLMADIVARARFAIRSIPLSKISVWTGFCTMRRSADEWITGHNVRPHQTVFVSEPTELFQPDVSSLRFLLLAPHHHSEIPLQI